MNPKLRAMLVSVGVVTLGGVSLVLYTPQPGNRTMAELRDAGIADAQRFVQICGERTTAQTRRRINTNQPGILRPKQVYARVARVATCHLIDGGAGNCFRPADGGLLVSDFGAEIIVPSLRQNLEGAELDAGSDDAGEDTAVDDAKQVLCQHLTCNQVDDLVDAGLFPNPYATRFCGQLNRLALLPLPNMIPDCRGSDGGWDDHVGEDGGPTPDCRFALPNLSGTPVLRWAGCNSYPASLATGTKCLPVESSVISGDLINAEWLP